MKLQWDTMTDFAKGVLRKLGAVPLSELTATKRDNIYLLRQYTDLLLDYNRVIRDRRGWPLPLPRNDLTFNMQALPQIPYYELRVRSAEYRMRIPHHQLENAKAFFDRRSEVGQYLLKDAVRSIIAHQTKEAMRLINEEGATLFKK